MSTLHTVRDLSPWRRVAASTWRPSDDPAIRGWIDVDATYLLAEVERLRRETGVRVTVTHLVGEAVAQAFAAHPSCNALVSLGRVRQRATVDVFFSVAVGDGKNLSGAKLERADELDAVAIARQLHDRAEEIRTRRDTPLQRSQSMLRHVPSPLLRPLMHLSAIAMFDLDLDLRRLGVPADPFGSAIVTNVGMLGVEQGFAPLMPQGRAPAIFTVGAIREKVVAVDGRPEVRPVLTLSGTFDHRVIDGVHLGAMTTMLRRQLEGRDLAANPRARRTAA